MRNNPSLNPDFPLASTAQAGTVLNWSSHIILPFIGDPNKVIDTWTDPSINGMIFYEIRKKRKSDKVESEDFVTAELRQTVGYYMMAGCDDVPEDSLNLVNVDTYGDLVLNNDIISWLDDVIITGYDPQSPTMDSPYITIEYPDGTTLYRPLNIVEMMAVFPVNPNYSYKELLEIYDGTATGWSQSINTDVNTNTPLVPIPNPGPLPTIPAINPNVLPVPVM